MVDTCLRRAGAGVAVAAYYGTNHTGSSTTLSESQ